MRGKFNDLTDRQFGRLKVIQRVPPPDHLTSYSSLTRVWWLCECHEGNRKIVSAMDLLSGDIRSCGCLRNERARALLNKAHEEHRIDGHAAFNHGIAWALKQLLAADHQDAADTLSREADALLAARMGENREKIDAAENRQKIDTLFRTITRVADDGRAVVVRG